MRSLLKDLLISRPTSSSKFPQGTGAGGQEESLDEGMRDCLAPVLQQAGEEELRRKLILIENALKIEVLIVIVVPDILMNAASIQCISGDKV